MKLFLKLLCALLFSGVAGATDGVPRLQKEYDPAKWPAANVKLSNSATLKDLFDSGLRPYRYPGLETSLLELKHLNLTLELGSGKSLPAITTEVFQIKPFTDGEISTIEGFTPKMTLSQAREEMRKWLPFASNGRTEQDLDKFLAAVESDPLNFDHPFKGITDGFGIGWNESGFGSPGGGAKCGLGFRKTANATSPLRLYFSLSWLWNRPTKDRQTYGKGPIPPPAGYEAVDMTAPASFGPDSAAEILRSQGVDIGDGKGGIPYKQFVEEQSRSAAGSPSGQIAEASATARRLPFWLLAAAVVGLVLIAVLAFRRRAPSGEEPSGKL